jgi:orotidine-5'-phosphate decarboxylase
VTPALIVALDEADAERAIAIVRRTSPHVDWFKVGYEAYYGYGARIAKVLKDAGKSLFLDLKLHDIPNTVAAGVRAAASIDARLLTVHAAGGAPMLSAAAAARDETSAGRMRLLAVTVLTSMTDGDLRETGVDKPLAHVALMRARLAARCRIDGAVCAVSEAAAVRASTSKDFAIVCPGIRPTGTGDGDQRRVATPAAAARAGADFIVVGRPITRAADPAAAAAAIVAELSAAS